MEEANEAKRVDVLNREEFVEQLVNLVKHISENQSSTCFALNGRWGSGKTFVLDMFEERLQNIQSEETAFDKYFIIRYNCWKYDYFNEPLVAVVSAIIKSVQDATRIFPDPKAIKDLMGKMRGFFATLKALATINGMQIDMGILPTLFTGTKKAVGNRSDKEEEILHFSENTSFEKAIEELSDALQEVAKRQTIVLLVDELDRCMPEYAIKVLERLHHLTEGKNNIITIISMDKSQLMTSMKQIFGFDDPEKYLEKFISFEVKLDLGNVSETVLEKYADYVSQFDMDIFPFPNHTDELVQLLFKDISAREQEQLMKKVKVAHGVLFKGQKKDYTFMYMELILAILICIYHDDSLFNDVSVDKLNRPFHVIKADVEPPFVKHINGVLDGYVLREHYQSSGVPFTYVSLDEIDLYVTIMYIWKKMHKRGRVFDFIIYPGNVYETISRSPEELMKFAEMIKMMS